jgi:hypothetical protein
VEECPKGYPQLAAFLDSDENFMLYRRFGFLQARLLLYKQDELSRLEQKLDRMDRRHAREDPSLLESRQNDDILNGDRKTLFVEIEKKFKDYGDSFLQIPRRIMETDQAQRHC